MKLVTKEETVLYCDSEYLRVIYHDGSYSWLFPISREEVKIFGSLEKSLENEYQEIINSLK